VNRPQRRAAARAPGGRALLAYADTNECPDCISEFAALARDRHGIFHADIRHNDTCPTLRKMHDRKRAEGKRHNAALICLARRRCDVLYAMLKNKTLYQPPVTAAA
jgi:hypothetical protein